MANRMMGLLRILVEETERQPLPWWLILPILLLIVVIVVWALNRSARATEVPHGAHHEPDEALAEAAQVVVASDRAIEPAAVESKAPPAIEVVSDRATELPPVMSVVSDRAIEPEALPAAPPEPNDLKIIEGIGPKIAGLLNQAGITTFMQLASADVADLRALMDRANLRIADPSTWPQQAALAAIGDWQGLQALQDSLKGGRQTH